MQELNPREAAALLQAEPAKIILLDVREPMELTLAALPGAVHIPMGEIPARLGELDRTKTIICMCHAGGRSWHVAAYLQQQGFRAANLIGGIHGWSLEVDGSVPTY